MSQEDHSLEEHKKSYYKVFGALMLLTAVTVGAAQLHFPHEMGQWGVTINLSIGLLIATVKVCLVMYIFMHLKFDNKFLRVFVLVPVFLFIVMVFALTVLEKFDHPL
jgi:caa(3)-type oxidase subunit IV